jgi:hypothetical protein
VNKFFEDLTPSVLFSPGWYKFRRGGKIFLPHPLLGSWLRVLEQ